MEINISQKIDNDRNSLVTFMIVHCLSHTLKDTFMGGIDKYKTPEGYIMDIKLIAGDIELDIEEFCDRWQGSVNNMIAREAKDLLEKRFGDLYGLLSDLERRIKPEIDSRMEEWEKE